MRQLWVKKLAKYYRTIVFTRKACSSVQLWSRRRAAASLRTAEARHYELKQKLHIHEPYIYSYQILGKYLVCHISNIWEISVKYLVCQIPQWITPSRPLAKIRRSTQPHRGRLVSWQKYL